MSDDYKQKRCRHGWVDESQCDACKTERELAAANARAEEAERKQAIDQRQCDDMTSEAGKMATELMAMTTRADELQAELNTSREQWRTMACPDCAMVESLKDERDALVEENRWHPASEPPDSDRDILVVTKKGHFYVDMWTEDTGYDTAGDAATHWRELPAPPKAEVAI